MDGRPVLVVDDDPAMRQAVVEILAFAGYPVASAVDGVDALRVVARGRPSLVITDLHMPNLDGEGLVAALRDRGFDPPILLMTGTQRRPEVVVIAVGADVCLLKPVDIDELLDAVERLRIP
jgi:CheY-like chemotaxis protein